MINNKGNSMIVTVISILIIISILPTTLMSPIQIKRKEKDINNSLNNNKELSQLNYTISKDILDSNYRIEMISDKQLKIGNIDYEFSNGIKRNNIILVKSQCEFEFSNDSLKVFYNNKELLFPFKPNANSIRGVDLVEKK